MSEEKDGLVTKLINEEEAIESIKSILLRMNELALQSNKSNKNKSKKTKKDDLEIELLIPSKNRKKKLILNLDIDD